MKIKQSAYKWWLLALMMISTAMAILDTTIINSVIPELLKNFNQTLTRVEWIVTGYLLSMCVMLPTAGWMAEKWGYKRIYIIGMVTFTLGSLFCYTSTNLDQLIAARVVEGFGSGIVQSLGLAIIIRNFDIKERTIALGLWGIASAAAVSMGPFLGGELLKNFGWNSLFIVNVPIGVLNIVGALIIMREVRDSDAGKFNFWGMLLTGLWAPMLVVGLAMGVSLGEGWLYGWDSPFVLSMLAGSLLMGVGFIFFNKRSESPVIDFTIFKDRSFSLSIIALGCLGFGFYGGNYLLPLYLEHSLSYSAIVVGGLYLPAGILQGVLAPISGIIAKRTGEWILVIIGFALFVIYLALSAFYNETTPYWLILLTVYMRGIGLGLAFTPLNALAVRSLSHDQMTSASGISNTVKQVSGSLGIAIFTAIIAESLRPSPFTAETPAERYVGSVDWSYIIAATLAFFGFIALFMMRKRRGQQA